MRCLAFLFGLSLVTRTASAGELRYRAPQDCPSRDEVQTRVDQRAPRARLADMSIQREGKDGSFVGEVVVGDGPDSVHRHLEGKTCAAVVNAMVLVLALDRPPEGMTTTTGTALASNPEPTTELEPNALPAKDRPVPDDHVAVRSAVELAVGASAIARQLDVATVFGGGLFVEVGAPAVLAPWYRPSARLGLQLLRSTSGTPLVDLASTFGGAAIELCPLGFAPLSTRSVDVTLAACGVLDVGSAGQLKQQLWVDGGAVGRAVIQIGPKDRVRGFVGVSGGAVQRLGAPFVLPTDGVLRSPNAVSVALYPPRISTMWTMAVGAGVVLP